MVSDESSESNLNLEKRKKFLSSNFEEIADEIIKELHEGVPKGDLEELKKLGKRLDDEICELEKLKDDVKQRNCARLDEQNERMQPYIDVLSKAGYVPDCSSFEDVMLMNQARDFLSLKIISNLYLRKAISFRLLQNHAGVSDLSDDVINSVLEKEAVEKENGPDWEYKNITTEDRDVQTLLFYFGKARESEITKKDLEQVIEGHSRLTEDKIRYSNPADLIEKVEFVTLGLDYLINHKENLNISEKEYRRVFRPLVGAAYEHLKKVYDGVYNKGFLKGLTTQRHELGIEHPISKPLRWTLYREPLVFQTSGKRTSALLENIYRELNGKYKE